MIGGEVWDKFEGVVEGVLGIFLPHIEEKCPHIT